MKSCLKIFPWLLALSAPLLARAADLAPSGSAAPLGPFLVKPYLQLGNSPSAIPDESLALLWHAEDIDAPWDVEYQPGPGDNLPWRKTETPLARRVAVPGLPPHRVLRASLNGLAPGETFTYRVKKAGEIVFSAQGRARKGPDQPHRFIAFGDCGVNSAEEKAIAHRAYLEHPDFVMITGDIVYDRGRASEYREKFWPVYNADEPDPAEGAPLLRSTLFIAAPGNHDIASRDLEKYPDTLAYFLYWDQPRNGPPGIEGRPHVPALKGPEANKAAFLDAAADSFPVMGNFSYNYGNAHWTVLDSNPYVDWTDASLRSWVERDLASPSARTATFRFVAYHHPGFNSSKKHFEQQNMRLMADVFEAGGVDVVFNGHVHNYQRTFPLRFVSARDETGKLVRNQEFVAGRWILDKTFDGQTRTRPQGVIYVITGAGGAHLYNPEMQDDPGSWQEFTHKYEAKVNSLTVADVDGPTLTIRQITADGLELDKFVITK